jgi:hypothetical protein
MNFASHVHRQPHCPQTASRYCDGSDLGCILGSGLAATKFDLVSPSGFITQVPCLISPLFGSVLGCPLGLHVTPQVSDLPNALGWKAQNGLPVNVGKAPRDQPRAAPAQFRFIATGWNAIIRITLNLQVLLCITDVPPVLRARRPPCKGRSTTNVNKLVALH